MFVVLFGERRKISRSNERAAQRVVASCSNDLLSRSFPICYFRVTRKIETWVLHEVKCAFWIRQAIDLFAMRSSQNFWCSIQSSRMPRHCNPPIPRAPLLQNRDHHCANESAYYHGRCWEWTIGWSLLCTNYPSFHSHMSWDLRCPTIFHWIK